MDLVKLILFILCLFLLYFLYNILFNLIFWGTFHNKLQREVARIRKDEIKENEFHDRVIKLCPRNIKRCDKCIYTAFVENPDLIKPCEKEYSKYE